jgi:hypothetical protein
MAGAAIRNLRQTSADVEVVLGGGVFRNHDTDFLDRIDRGLREIAPRVRIKQLHAPPLVGAALMGLDLRWAPEAAKERARASLTHAHLDAARDLVAEGGQG